MLTWENPTVLAAERRWVAEHGGLKIGAAVSKANPLGAPLQLRSV